MYSMTTIMLKTHRKETGKKPTKTPIMFSSLCLDVILKYFFNEHILTFIIKKN